MQHKINIDLIIENPQLFLSGLPEEAKLEFQQLLEFIIFKYDLSEKFLEKNIKKKYKIFREKPIEVDRIVKYSREELHDR